MVAFSSSGAKHSSTFAGGAGEFVWNLATWDLREQMNLTSAKLPRGESEFEHAGLEAAPSRLVAPPRVAASPCALECRVVHAVAFEDVDGTPADQYLVVGQVVGVHVDESAIRDGGSTPRRCARSPAAATSATTPWSTSCSSCSARTERAVRGA